MPVDNEEDLLDLFASVALIGMGSKHLSAEIMPGEYHDAISRKCYTQAQSMIRVRQEFIKD